MLKGSHTSEKSSDVRTLVVKCGKGVKKYKIQEFKHIKLNFFGNQMQNGQKIGIKTISGGKNSY